MGSREWMDRESADRIGAAAERDPSSPTATSWLLTYPLTGWLSTTAGFTITWAVLAVLAVAGIAVALRMWPRKDPAELTHLHEVGTIDPVRLGDAVRVDDRHWLHTHVFVIDAEHPRWPRTERPTALAA